jgi:hypothetical protein
MPTAIPNFSRTGKYRRRRMSGGALKPTLATLYPCPLAPKKCPATDAFAGS